MARLQSGTRIYGNAIIDTFVSVNGNSGPYNATSNITGALRISGGIGLTGNIFSSGNITSNNANLGNLIVANYVTGTLTTNAQPNITSVGTLSGLTVVGDTNITGNLVVTGNTTYVNSNIVDLEDRIIELGNGANGASLTVDDQLDRGIQVHYFKSSEKNAFFGVANDSLAFEYYVDGSETAGVFGGTYGNIKGLTFISTATTGTSPFTINSTTEVANLKAQYANTADKANTANTVTVNAQPNITSVGTLSGLTVNGITNLGVVGNIRIYGGSSGYTLSTDGTGNLSWVTTSTGTGNANVSGSNTQIFFNDSNSNTLGTSANLTFDKTSNTLTVDKIVANGASLSSLTGSNVTGQVGNALVAGTVYTNAQPNITSVGTLTSLTVTGNITSGNAKLGNLVTANFFTGDGGLLSNIVGSNVTGNVANANLAGYVTQGNQSNITSVGTLSSLIVTANITSGNANLGNVVTANYFVGNGSQLTNISASGIDQTSLLASTATLVTSNITNVVPGSTIAVVADYSNITYPGGIFTIAQLGPVSLSMTDIWKESGSATKNAYANYLANTINEQNVNVSFTLANATFSVQSSDYILIGSANITGTKLTSLSISGTGGTYTIPYGNIGDTVEIATTSTVSAHLTTSRGVYTATGTTLTATQPVAFNVNSVSGSFPSSTVPYFSLNQSFNWSVSVTGTASAGNLTYSGGSIGTTSLTTTGTTSGTSTSIDSTSSYTLTTSDYYGAGLYGYGSRTIPSTVTGTVSAATKYYPLFYKINTSSSNPNFTTSDTYLTHNYVTGDGATTGSSTSQYLWIAVPGSSSHTFAYTFLGSPVGQDPAVTFTSQTISGYTYNVYGFTNFSAATLLYTVT
jgi:hypothetical protein